MSAPERVDVLAVMDRLIESNRRAGISEVGPFAELIESRAAVAELIEALNRALPTVEHYYHTNPDPDGSLWRDVLACRAALASVQGGQS